MKSPSPLVPNLYLSIANFTIGLRFHPPEQTAFIENDFRNRVRTYYQNFLGDGNKKVDYWIDIYNKPEFKVIKDSNSQDVYINMYQDVKKNRSISYTHLGGFQFEYLIRHVIQRLLSQHQGFLIHGSAAKVQDKAYIFLGPSGAGKSTTISTLSVKFESLADDMFIIRQVNHQFLFYQLPFSEKSTWIKRSNNSYQLGKAFFLKKAKVYKAKKITSPVTIFKKMSTQLYTETEDHDNQSKYLFDLINTHPDFYTLHFSLASYMDMIELVENV